ncbi:hypothetical protein GALMADRAFT_81806 [Galerina marginata CBS 339.88]|uniref:Uncharacterized protein n=1 Tax=Galerina marginata (strain CBS 339.88) TaxID=685588 RepID=A0A067S3T4_GALM3|nr:hypothetical protein GALMADRAFT_81806 [Galerina marginata CBS 339.88]
MPARTVFQGLRLEFLMKNLKDYSDAVTQGTKEDFLKDIMRRFFKRFPPQLALSQEPSKDDLAAVDDSKPDPEPEVPKENSLSPQDYATAVGELTERSALIKLRTGQVARWFAYRHEKSHGSSDAINPENPITILMARLTGHSTTKPRKPIAYNSWAKENKAALFNKLPEKERRKWEKDAEKAHKVLLEGWEQALRRPASTDPEARQRCIDSIAGFMQPILDLVVEFTGMPSSFIMGGPEPADQGRLNIISLHSGVVKGPVSLTFPQAERTSYKEKILPAFSDFLKKCFSPQDCRDAALPIADSSMLRLFEDDTAAVLVSGLTTPSVSVSVSAPPAVSSSHPTSSTVASAVQALPSPITVVAPAASSSADARPLEPSRKKQGSADGGKKHSAADTDDKVEGAKRRKTVGKENTTESDVRGKKRKSRIEGSDAPPAKRGKHTSSKQASSSSTVPATKSSKQTSSLTVVPPTNSQPFIKDAVKMFSSGKFGEEWDAAIATWLRFEHTYAHKSSTKIRFAANLRPVAVGDWIQRARSIKWRPAELDEGGEWDALNKPGANGWVSVIAALFFWGDALGDTQSVSWTRAVEDVTWVLEQMCSEHNSK